MIEFYSYCVAQGEGEAGEGTPEYWQIAAAQRSVLKEHYLYLEI
jgi:hypothetical protein